MLLGPSTESGRNFFFSFKFLKKCNSFENPTPTQYVLPVLPPQIYPSQVIDITFMTQNFPGQFVGTSRNGPEHHNRAFIACATHSSPPTFPHLISINQWFPQTYESINQAGFYHACHDYITTHLHHCLSPLTEIDNSPLLYIIPVILFLSLSTSFLPSFFVEFRLYPQHHLLYIGTSPLIVFPPNAAVSSVNLFRWHQNIQYIDIRLRPLRIFERGEWHIIELPKPTWDNLPPISPRQRFQGLPPPYLTDQYKFQVPVSVTGVPRRFALPDQSPSPPTTPSPPPHLLESSSTPYG